ncbi:hypothetical protein P8452_42227 [Trifolium repens]|nr:hypothetical protein P8452_42227 [Trifolium repens]
MHKIRLRKSTSKKKTIANARRSYGTYENSTVKSTVSAAIKTQLCSLPPTNQSPLLSFSSTEECFRRFSQQSYLQSTRVLDAVIVVKLMLANSLFPEVRTLSTLLNGDMSRLYLKDFSIELQG